jgi:hypothetical protein
MRPSRGRNFPPLLAAASYLPSFAPVLGYRLNPEGYGRSLVGTSLTPDELRAAYDQPQAIECPCEAATATVRMERRRKGEKTWQPAALCGSCHANQIALGHEFRPISATAPRARLLFDPAIGITGNDAGRVRPNPRNPPGGYSAQARAFLSQKIPLLMREGYPQAQAEAIAFNYARQLGLHVPNPLTGQEAHQVLTHGLTNLSDAQRSTTPTRASWRAGKAAARAALVSELGPTQMHDAAARLREDAASVAASASEVGRGRNPADAHLRKLLREAKADPTDPAKWKRLNDEAYRSGMRVRIDAPHGGHGYLNFPHESDPALWRGVDDVRSDVLISPPRVAKSAQLVPPLRWMNPQDEHVQTLIREIYAERDPVKGKALQHKLDTILARSGDQAAAFRLRTQYAPNPLTASETSELQRLARISNVFANQHLAGALPVQAAFSYGHSSGVMEAATALAPEDAQLREAAIANYKRVHDGLDEAGRVAFKLREKLPVGKIRTPNPLSVLVLGNDPERAQNGCAPVMRPRRSQNPAPPAGTLGLKEVLAHNQEFHGAPVGRWIHVQIPDGSDKVTRRAYSGLGLVDASVYSVPDKASNKHGEVWEHVHERKKPLEVYDPISHTTLKVLEPGTGPSDWWRDNVGPQGPWRRP